MQMFTVGGHVRDEIMGVKSNDIDFTVVLDDGDIVPRRTKAGRLFTPEPFDIMVDILKSKGFRIFLETRQHLTVRAQFPRFTNKELLIGAGNSGLTADFVLARKEGTYSDGRRPDSVEVGTLEDDLARRDFTMNAIAKDAEGNFIDPFDGQRDIAHRIIRAVGFATERLEEDALRAVRAMRFSVTSGFMIHPNLEAAMRTQSVLDAVANKISDERIMAEINKMFKHGALGSLAAFNRHPALTNAMFAGRVNLEATMKQKGFA